MTHAAVRKAIGQQYFSVICDACHGKMFSDGKLCWKCDGEGRVVIAERTVKTPISENGKLAIVIAVGLGLGVLMALAILM